MFQSITRRPLWFNILVGIGGVLLLFLLFALSLNWITRHGVARTVPSVTGKSLSEVTSLLEGQGFEVVVQDSVFYDSLPPGLVLKQVPEADAVVKENRAVFITINRFVPPDIEMPNLVGYSFRNAEMVLANLGLRLGDTTFRPDFARNSVLEQLVNGKAIAAGTKIKVGTPIALIIGSGLGNEYISVPTLLGLTYEEAKVLMEANGLIIGAVLPDPTVRDNSTAFVYWQNPNPRTEDGKALSIRPGQMIDIRLSLERPNVDSLLKLQQRPPEPADDEDESGPFTQDQY